MNRRFWGGTILVSLLITSGSAFYVYHQVQNKEIISMMTVEETPLPIADPAPVSTPIATPNEEPLAASSTPTPVEPVVAEPPVEGAAVAKRNILFALPRPNAKSVTIIGDFNDWKPDSMMKKGKKWERVVSLEPGTYKYLFIVDKKQIRDPNNKVVSDGKSVITVKPLSSGK